MSLLQRVMPCLVLTLPTVHRHTSLCFFRLLQYYGIAVLQFLIAAVRIIRYFAQPHVQGAIFIKIQRGRLWSLETYTSEYMYAEYIRSFVSAQASTTSRAKMAAA